MGNRDPPLKIKTLIGIVQINKYLDYKIANIFCYIKIIVCFGCSKAPFH